MLRWITGLKIALGIAPLVSILGPMSNEKQLPNSHNKNSDTSLRVTHLNHCCKDQSRDVLEHADDPDCQCACRLSDSDLLGSHFAMLFSAQAF